MPRAAYPPLVPERIRRDAWRLSVGGSEVEQSGVVEYQQSGVVAHRGIGLWVPDVLK